MNKKVLILLILIVLSLFGCTKVDNNINKNPNPIDPEVYDYEHHEFETKEQMVIFYENIDFEQFSLEEKIDELIEAESYNFEIKINNKIKEEIIDYLPPELYDYDINWSEILGKYAIGTSVIIFTGILHVATLNTPVAYVFTSSFYGAIREAFTGALIGAAINVAINGISTGDFSQGAVLKYALEGSADGFMWGAITGAILGAFKASPPTISDEIKPLIQKGRYAKTNGSFTVKQDEVFYLGQKIGMVDDLGNVIGTGSYKGVSLDGQKLFSINANGQIGNYNFRSIQQGFKFDAIGNLLNVNYFENAISIGNGATQVANVFNGNVLSGKIIRATDHLGVTRDYLMSTVDGRISSILNTGLSSTLDDWNSVISSLASSGVNNAKNGIIQAVQSGKMSPTQLQTYVSLSDDARQLYNYNTLWSYLKTNGRFPPELNMAGHHINNVANYPWLANNPNNIRMVDAMQHRIEHNFNFQNATNGALTNLLNLIGIG